MRNISGVDEPVASVRRVGYRHQASGLWPAKIAILTVFDFNSTTFRSNPSESKPLNCYALKTIGIAIFAGSFVAAVDRWWPDVEIGLFGLRPLAR